MINQDYVYLFSKKNINLGIELLRVILCFWVLAFHSLYYTKVNPFLFYIFKTKFFHVPCFSFISFYFTDTVYVNQNKMKKRLVRLLIPYIFWPIIIFAIHNISGKKITISLHDLKIQLICGYQFLLPLWYLFGIILISILFFILKNLFSKHFLFVIQLISIFSYIFQYSGFHILLDKFKDNIKSPILYTMSIIPLSALGLSFSSLKIVSIIYKNRKITLFFSFLFIYFLFKYDIFVDIGKFMFWN